MGPLDGIRILDLTTMISGPLATQILGDQGAQIIKVEAPGGDFVRAGRNRAGELAAAFLNNNRNKQSIVIDLKADGGTDVLKRLAKTVDVVVQNFRPGVVDRMGIGYDAMKEMKDDIIYVSIAGFGETGPYAPKPVYDPIIQALSGLASIQGGGDTHRPRLVRTILPDKLTGVTASQAITAALLARERTGKGQHVRLSMLDSVLQFLWSSDYGSQTFVGREVSIARAASFIDLIYETDDGYMSVAVMSDKQWQATCQALGHPEWLDDDRFKTPALRDRNINDRLELIQGVLKTDTTENWLRILEDAGVPCAPVLKRRDVVHHPQVEANNTLVEYDHPHAGRLRQTRPAARFSGTPSDVPTGAPLLGEHTDAVLMAAGFSADEIRSLHDKHIIKKHG